MNFRERLEQGRMQLVTGAPPTELDENFTCPYFATERGKNPACVDFRLPDGRRMAMPYSHFAGINYDLEKGIEIQTGGKKVTITGRNLTKLYEYLIMYRVRYVQANMGTDAGEDGLFVKEIRVEDLGMEF